mmetsp:Transcript_43306/g.50134  ORF Transcript_43306/g.50134 Transcript_43306/m.50134 type:complete len:200 (+) Transcript_43306:65-664(+)|eukprot:CAMPEP_0176463016 /NCGR_PEP_ID=MMETSP0127-20121128/35617_1 /TAXON_ID=938130 /ORGANISM="Platyophrya macrostoma, Strain WH" /LENGTH=199 /DNA_ID=CAMNT_0017855055 /DNA_START=64 /DNA_END=663 /DNA_ORIENTATION=+
MERQVAKKLITVVGGTSKIGLTANRDEIVCKKLGILLADAKNADYHIQTGGTGGYPAFVSQAFGARLKELDKPFEERIYHYVPYKSTSMTKGLLGKTVGCADTMKQRREVLMKLPAEVVLAISGGPGTSNEINWANSLKKNLICFVGSGGAAAGLFPDEDNISPKIPDNCLKNELLSSKDIDADPEKIAEELFKFISKY